MKLLLDCQFTKIISAECGIFVKTLPPLKYKIRKLPHDVIINTSNEYIVIDNIHSDKYKNLRLHFFDIRFVANFLI